ncbi:MAG: ATP-dependent DNA helicase [Lachnospiraceae bacterium]|nr:ATP-dependent DNA helicase [Lachnospiraceae bacterium]
MDENKTINIEISVRDLVEFILRSGDIDNRISQGDMTAMQDGSRLHRKLQKAAGENSDYRSEVLLKTEAHTQYDGEEVVLAIEGRADGIFQSDGLTVIDEIKTTLVNVNNMSEPVPVHRAQAMCYACIYAEKYGTNDETSEYDDQDEGADFEAADNEKDQDEGANTDTSENDILIKSGNKRNMIGIRMTYCNRETEEIAYFREDFEIGTLKEWFDKLVGEYAKWAVWEVKWRRKRNKTIKESKFPFEYREGQKRLVAAVYKSIGSGKKLFIEAPTGVGKTMSTVFPAVWSMGEDKTEKIFYGTAKTIARTVAEEAFSILRDKGIKIRSVTITSKEKLCILEKPECNPETCERAKGHFDRVNDCVYDMLTNEEYIDREMILKYAEKHMVCPFEMCLDVTLWADAVICDYNYLFDPTVHLKRFFDGNKRKYCLLIDEAHNLVERAREMYSAELIKEDFIEAKALLKTDSNGNLEQYVLADHTGSSEGSNSETGNSQSKQHMQNEHSKPGRLNNDTRHARDRVAAAMEACNKALLKVKRETDSFQVWEECGPVITAVERFCGVYEEVSKDLKLPSADASKVRDVYFAARHFVNMHDEMEDDYEVYSNYTSERHFRLRLQCMDPARKLGEYLMLSESAVMFSATLLPIRYYMEQLGGKAEDYSVYAPSPFDRSKRLLMVARDVSTKYTRRNDEEYAKIADYILKFIRGRRGNYLVYFPSYAVMEEVCEKLEEKLTDGSEDWDRLTGGTVIREKTVDGTETEKSLADGETTGSSASDENFPAIEISMQGRNMTEQEKEEFLSSFTEDPDRTHVGLCVMGGLFAEGIDLKNDRLIGVVVVGTGLPMVCDERELFRVYFDEKNNSGFEYAYLYNGMNKVMQAAGRVIRTMEDTGAILLLDERFLNRQYLELFPREWSDYRTVTLNSVNKELEDFWKIH